MNMTSPASPFDEIFEDLNASLTLQGLPPLGASHEIAALLRDWCEPSYPCSPIPYFTNSLKEIRAAVGFIPCRELVLLVTPRTEDFTKLRRRERESYLEMIELLKSVGYETAILHICGVAVRGYATPSRKHRNGIGVCVGGVMELVTRYRYGEMRGLLRNI